MLLIPYLVFSLIAATKMPAYCYIACLPLTIALGSFAWYCMEQIQARKWAYSNYLITILLILFAWFSINLQGIAKLHTGFDPENVYRINKVAFTEKFRKLKGTIPQDYVVFNVPEGWEIEMMYYTGNTCYHRIPDLKEYEQLKSSGIKMAIVLNDKTPLYMMNDDNVLKIKLD